jgi:hypothetical protein
MEVFPEFFDGQSDAAWMPGQKQANSLDAQHRAHECFKDNMNPYPIAFRPSAI